VWISTMLIATNQISECLHNLGVSSWHFATTVTYIMKIHIMEVMNFCLHDRNLFREMVRRYWKRSLQNCLWCQEIQIQSTSWVWWTQFLYLNLPLLLCFCRLCFKSSSPQQHKNGPEAHVYGSRRWGLMVFNITNNCIRKRLS
jgi:hypothetical protein